MRNERFWNDEMIKFIVMLDFSRNSKMCLRLAYMSRGEGDSELLSLLFVFYSL